VSDTIDLEEFHDTKAKALYRRGLAYYHLENYTSSFAAMKCLCDQYPENESGKMELEQIKLRMMEETSPNINFKSLSDKVTELRPPHLNHATYTGPVMIGKSHGRGRGLFTTRDVKAGELLLFEKAFAHCYAPPLEDTMEASLKTSLPKDEYTDRMNLKIYQYLLSVAVQKLYKNPSLMSSFNELHHGSGEHLNMTVCDGASSVVNTYVIPCLRLLYIDH
jgi:hypothetical protein